MNSTNLAPGLIRSWMVIELKISKSSQINSAKVSKFQKKLAIICGMHIFCGPMVIAPDSENDLSPYYANKEFKPRDWNAYTWWTQPDAKNITSILDYSHTSFYFYPKHQLINITIATCKDYQHLDALAYIKEFWKPEGKIKYSLIEPSKKTSSWKQY